MSGNAAKSAIENIRAQLKDDVEVAIEKAKLSAIHHDLQHYGDICEDLEEAKGALLDFLSDGFYPTEVAVDVFIGDSVEAPARKRIEFSILQAAE